MLDAWPVATSSSDLPAVFVLNWRDFNFWELPCSILILHCGTSSVTIQYIFPSLHFGLLLRVFAFPVPWEQRQVLWLSTLRTVFKMDIPVSHWSAQVDALITVQVFGQCLLCRAESDFAGAGLVVLFRLWAFGWLELDGVLVLFFFLR